MIQLFKITIAAIIIFLFAENLDFSNSSYDSYSLSGYTYHDTLINVYEINDEILMQSKKIAYYQNTNSNYNESVILDNITFESY